MKNILIFSALLLVPIASARADWRTYNSGNSSIYAAQNSYIGNSRHNNHYPRHNSFKNCDTPRGPRFYNNSHYSHNKPKFFAYSQIKNGIRSGELSPRETRELREELFDIKRKENHYWADGYLSKWERESLRDDYKDFRHDLKHELNDGEHRWR